MARNTPKIVPPIKIISLLLAQGCFCSETHPNINETGL